jgi:hypothetical protein
MSTVREISDHRSFDHSYVYRYVGLEHAHDHINYISLGFQERLSFTVSSSVALQNNMWLLTARKNSWLYTKMLKNI